MTARTGRPRVWILGLLLAAIPGSGCGGGAPGTRDPEPAAASPPSAQEIRADRRAAFHLLRVLSDRDGTLVVSPLSVRSALALAWEGARGPTRAELESAFGFTEGASASGLLSSIAPGDSGLVLEVANRVWGDDGLSVLDSYSARLRERHRADLERVSFRRPEAARARINAWIAEATHDRIPELLPPGSITPRTRLALTNAVAFRGLWTTPFDPERTRTLPFTLESGDEIPVPQMSRTDRLAWGSGEFGQIVDLPYRGGTLAMTLVLPPPDGSAGALLSDLTAETFDAWLATLQPTRIALVLPRFEARVRLPLASPLRDMGVVTAFDPAGADFGGIAPGERLFLETAVHEAWIRVDEEGTEAAAATGAVIGVTSMPPEVRFDRPFLFFVRDTASGVVIFAGRIADPRPESG